jgi:hypothetical protein
MVLSSILSAWPNFSIAIELVAFLLLEVPSAQKHKCNFFMTRSKPGRHGSNTDVDVTNLQSCSPLCALSSPFLFFYLRHLTFGGSQYTSYSWLLVRLEQDLTLLIATLISHHQCGGN